jgi:hypothetical protein
MIHYHGLLNKDYGWELTLFSKIGKYREHITFFNVDVEWGRNHTWDHSPNFMFDLNILNINLIEFNIYFIWHRDDDGKPIKPDGTPIDICNNNSTSLTSTFTPPTLETSQTQ